MSSKTRVAILDDHPGTVDGYRYRLDNLPDIEIVGVAAFGEDFEPMLARQAADIVLLDINVPTAPDNRNSYPILHVIPKLLQKYPDLTVLVISMFTDRSLIKAVMKAGASGYIFKDDQAAHQQLASVVRSVAGGGVHFSEQAHKQLLDDAPEDAGPVLTPRQAEALSLCAAYPDRPTANLATMLGISNSTIRNLLSGAYLRLDVSTRAAGIMKAQQLGLITPPVTLPASLQTAVHDQ